MPSFSKESLQILREKMDLVEVLSTHVDLKTKGNKKVGLCPFHEEKTPSFVVQQGDSHYHCFGCGAHGDAIQFLMQFLRLSFVEAVEFLAEKYHVPMEKDFVTESQGPSKTLLKDAMQVASRFYQCYLLHTKEGEKALFYLYERGIDLGFIRRFGIGLSPQRKDIFLRYMQAKKIDIKVLEQAGLLRTFAGGVSDFYSGRITIPILDLRLATIGFSARKYEEKQFGPKYVNTPETPIFKKSRVLFGLGYARKKIIQKKSFLLVEGQIDALRLHQAGFDTTVASQGTAFTEEQAKALLSLGVEKAWIAFDADSAGKNSAEKIGALLQKHAVDTWIVTLPENSDPDILLMEKGPKQWQKFLDDAKDYLTFLYEKKRDEMPGDSPGIKTKIVTDIANTIRSWKEPLLVHEHLCSLSKIANVPQWTLGIDDTVQETFVLPKIAQSTIDPNRVLEADFLRILFLLGESHTHLVDIATQNLCANQLKTPSAKRLYAFYLEKVTANQSFDLLECNVAISAEDQDFLENLLQKRVDEEKAKSHLLHTIQKILENRWMEKREAIKNAIISGKQDEQEALALAKQFEELKKDIPKVQMQASDSF